MDIIRFLLIFVLQLSAVGIMITLLIKYTKMKGKSIFFKLSLTIYSIAGLLNVIYFFIQNELVLSILYSLTISCTLLAPLAIFFLNLNFSRLLNQKKQLLLFGITAIILIIANYFATIFYINFPGGKPYWSLIYGMIIIFFYSSLIVLNGFYLYKIYKKLPRDQQKLRWKYFSTGIIVLSLVVLLSPISNMMPPDSILRAIGLLFILAPISVCFIYYSMVHNFEGT